MKKFMDLWSKKDSNELVVYWTCRNGKYVSAIKQHDGTFSTVCSDVHCGDMKSKASRLLTSINGDAKLVWKKA